MHLSISKNFYLNKINIISTYLLFFTLYISKNEEKLSYQRGVWTTSPRAQRTKKNKTSCSFGKIMRS